MDSTGVGRGFGGGRRTKWTPQQDARIRELAAEGKLVAEVAAEFGVSRNMVIGRARRLQPRVEWAYKPAPPLPPGVPRPTKHRGGQRRRTYRGPDMSQRGPVPANAPTSLDVGVYDLRAHHCRYPYGNRVPYLFCGAEVDPGCSYCAFHRAMTCVPPVRTPLFLPPTIAVT
jgi:hypothetical protein